MTDKLKPMDVYADMTVPFDVATYCRGHRYAPESVNLTRAINARKTAEELLEKAEQAVQHARDMQNVAALSVRNRMEKDQHV